VRGIQPHDSGDSKNDARPDSHSNLSKFLSGAHNCQLQKNDLMKSGPGSKNQGNKVKIRDIK
jgi:hypothetical protein